MWGQSVTFCFLWRCHKSLTTLMYASPPSFPVCLVTMSALSWPRPAPCSQGGLGSNPPLNPPPQPSSLHFPTWNKAPFRKCFTVSRSLFFFLLSAAHVSGVGLREQVWWDTRYVLWAFAFVSPTTAAAPLSSRPLFFLKPWCVDLMYEA